MTDTLGWTIIGAAWLLGSFGGGAVLAWFYRRLYSGLSFHKLWALWTAVLGITAAIVFGMGWA